MATPELQQQYDKLQKWKVLGYIDPVAREMFKEAKQVKEGYLETDFLFNPDEDGLESGRYRIELTAQESEEWLNAAQQFVRNPLTLGSFSDKLGPELEALTCGSEVYRYEKIDEPKPKPPSLLNRIFPRANFIWHIEE